MWIDAQGKQQGIKRHLRPRPRAAARPPRPSSDASGPRFPPSLVQFDTLGPFVLVVVLLTSINLAIGSVLEPMLMGNFST